MREDNHELGWEALLSGTEFGAVTELLREITMIAIRNMRGRWPERRIRLQDVDMRVYTRELAGGGLEIRLDNRLDPSFWLMFDLVAEDKATGKSEGPASDEKRG